eukprot:comp39799_c0_seq1/m.47398 comp39799_c0_seq1/g.47398  ORF comp39799_c0_seq1/g.47398 comp39799_c0_seq1/m.47398 type:complete len:376 (-) comp39799_c0_seq1:905-2032(-)
MPPTGETSTGEDEKKKGPLPRVAIIGTGWGTRVQVPVFRKCGFTVTAVWARTQKKAEKVASELGIPFATCVINEILLNRDVDLVSIATPPHLHADYSIMAIRAGKHVICEKPTALNATEAFKMLEAAQYYPQLLAIIDHELRFLPTVNTMREKVMTGYCGRVILLEAKVKMGALIRGDYNWWCDESLGGGALGALGPHIIDALTYVTGLKCTDVHGTLKTFTKTTNRIEGFRHITSDDYCSFQMKYENDVHGTVLLNTHMPGIYEQEIMVLGTEGRLILRGADLWGYRMGMEKEEVIMTLPDARYSPFVKGTEFMFQCLKDAFEKDDLKLMADAATFEDGLHTQLVMDGVRKSSTTGKWVHIKMPESNGPPMQKR